MCTQADIRWANCPVNCTLITYPGLWYGVLITLTLLRIPTRDSATTAVGLPAKNNKYVNK